MSNAAVTLFAVTTDGLAPETHLTMSAEEKMTEGVGPGMRTERRSKPLSQCIKCSLDVYFSNLAGHSPGNLYDLVLSEVEKPLLEIIMDYSQGNMTRAASLLGINRSTLRKKLLKYGLD